MRYDPEPNDDGPVLPPLDEDALDAPDDVLA